MNRFYYWLAVVGMLLWTCLIIVGFLSSVGALPDPLPAASPATTSEASAAQQPEKRKNLTVKDPTGREVVFSAVFPDGWTITEVGEKVFFASPADLGLEGIIMPLPEHADLSGAAYATNEHLQAKSLACKRLDFSIFKSDANELLIRQIFELTQRGEEVGIDQPFKIRQQYLFVGKQGSAVFFLSMTDIENGNKADDQLLGIVRSVKIHSPRQ